jgi:hypothetical protein
MRKSYAEVHIEGIMGEPLSSEDSQKMVRYIAGVLGVLILISVIEMSGLFDFPGKWDGSIFEMLFWVFIGIMIGLGWAHGWPKQISEKFQLSPSLQHEEE